MCVCVGVWVGVFAYMHEFVGVHVGMCVHVYMDACMYTCVSTCTYVRVHMYTLVDVYICMYMYTLVDAYIHMRMYIQSHSTFPSLVTDVHINSHIGSVPFVAYNASHLPIARCQESPGPTLHVDWE